MSMYFIGLGLNDEKDISIKALEIVKKADIVYLETYTSKLNAEINNLERLYNKKIIKADRNMVENEAEKTILKNAKEKKVAFLVIGDPLTATTHVDLFLRAKKSGIKVKVVHNASILTAVGITGLELYKFGKTTSIPFNNENIKSPIDTLKNNQKLGLHTLFLLDLEPEKNKFLTISEAINYLIKNKVSENTKAVACASLGSEKPFIKFDLLKNLKMSEIAMCNLPTSVRSKQAMLRSRASGTALAVSEHAQKHTPRALARGSVFDKLKISKFPQCLIIPGKLHFMEEEMLEFWK